LGSQSLEWMESFLFVILWEGGKSVGRRMIWHVAKVTDGSKAFAPGFNLTISKGSRTISEHSCDKWGGRVSSGRHDTIEIAFTAVGVNDGRYAADECV
jgi:hypothetical protein